MLNSLKLNNRKFGDISSRGEAFVYTQTFPLHLSSLTAAAMCSNVPREYIVSQKRSACYEECIEANKFIGLLF